MICIDTAVLIWGVQGVAKGSHRQRMVDLTDRYLRSLREFRQIAKGKIPISEVPGSRAAGRTGLRRLTKYDLAGQPFTVRYHALNAMLLNELQVSRSGERPQPGLFGN